MNILQNYQCQEGVSRWNPINDEHPAKTEYSGRSFRCNSYIIEQAEAHRSVRLGMMPRRST